MSEFDFNKVRLIGITKPTVDFIPDSEGIVSFCARVSNPSNQDNFETANKLLAYCVKNHHWSVFDMVNLVVEVETPRDIARQILRHSSMKFQEFSQRYAEAQNFVIRDARMQDQKNRQNSIECEDGDIKEWWDMAQSRLLDIFCAVLIFITRNIFHYITLELTQTVSMDIFNRLNL